MQLIENNNYRILGVLASNSQKDTIRQNSKFQKYISVNKRVISDLDFSFLNEIERTKTSLKKAFSNLERNENKIISSLFWFANLNDFDDVAISYLIEGEYLKARETWMEVSKNKTITDKTISSFNNLSTLEMYLQTVETKEFNFAIKTKFELIKSPHFNAFIQAVADNTFGTSSESKRNLENLFLDELFQSFQSNMQEKELLNLFSECDENIKDRVLKKITTPIISEIESQFETAKRDLKSTPTNAVEIGYSLYAQTEQSFFLLNNMLTVSDFIYKRLADKVALELVQCDIINFNKFHEEKDTSKDCYILMDYAQKIAIGQETKNKIKDNKERQENYTKYTLSPELIAPINQKTNELNQAIGEPLISPYIKDIKRLLKKLPSHVDRNSSGYINISSKAVNAVLKVIMIQIDQKETSCNKSALIKFLQKALKDLSALESFAMDKGTQQSFLQIENRLKKTLSHERSIIENLMAFIWGLISGTVELLLTLCLWLFYVVIRYAIIGGVIYFLFKLAG